jgi:hypothetical protein
MARSNLNTQAKRKRELARMDKRAAKDRKRALRKAERAARATAAGAATPESATAARIVTATGTGPAVPPKDARRSR